MKTQEKIPIKELDCSYFGLTYGDLQTITEENSKGMFDIIMKVLRYNAISDKSNAFNKLLNLFICKIVDEDRQPGERVDFQLLEADGPYDLQMRLNDLYQKGMWRFFKIRVVDYSRQEIEELTDVGDKEKQKELKEALTRLRLLKNLEFAFIEVFNQRTFDANDRILRKIVGYLQNFKFRYADKHQFLGNFFELLLSTNIKQESGQFFTPLPITRFILTAFPLQAKVDAAVAAGKRDFLPTVIDYACGSGHFLIEYLEQMQKIIETYDFSQAKPSISKKACQYRATGRFSWAEKYVYGIELDYRLVKTAKVSTFFHGNGSAKIIWANGLGSFVGNPEYHDKLCRVSKTNKHDNAMFDILFSNPPYSVKAFKPLIKNGTETFELFDDFTDKSKEIECLFVERMKQLLKPGGWAGIILPSSLMTNGGIHTKTREILFRYFRFKAIVEMSSGTFMKTGTNTVILFLERRENREWKLVETLVANFFVNHQDVTTMGIEKAFSRYAYLVRGEGLSDYITFLGQANQKTITIEKDKLLYFILTYSQMIVLVKSGQKLEEKALLGYEFSMRRGREGLRPLAAGGKLTDRNDPTNPAKVSSYIYNAFLKGPDMPIHKTVANHVSYERLSSLICFDATVWSKQVFLQRQPSGCDHIF